MMDLKFANTHNLVAFLSKPAESEGFEQIVDFLNANPINYALMVNPSIYTSCIEQFWSTVKEKTVNREVQLQALVEGKKIIVTEESVRRDLQLKDDEGTDFLPNATIFEQLTLMGMVRNVENVSGKFLMYPRFVQVFLNQQVGDMSNHKRIYVTPFHTKKIFGNMKREGKGFSRRVTPLFLTMMVQAQDEMGEGLANPTDPHHTPTIIQPSTSQPQKKQKHRKPKRKNTKDSLKLEELMALCTTLQQRVLALETTKTTQAHEIDSLKRRVISSEYEGLGEEDASKQGRKIHDIDADEDITLENVHDAEMFDVNELHGDEVFVEKEVPVKEVSAVGKVNAASLATTASAAIITEVDITLAQALAELKSAKPKAITTLTTTAAITITATSTRPTAKGLAIDEHEQAPTPTPIVSSSQSS
ncbi:hypothetical protein Tco_0669846 [Tanacetum coccineum]